MRGRIEAPRESLPGRWVYSVIALVIVAACGNPNLRTPNTEFDSSASFCAYSIEFENRSNADQFVANAAQNIVEPALSGRLFLVREEDRLTWVRADESGPCSKTDAPEGVGAPAMNVTAGRVTARELADKLAVQRIFVLNEVEARQCVVIARLTPSGTDAEGMSLLYSLGSVALPSKGLFEMQTEAADGATYFATGSSCDALEAILGQINAHIPWHQRKIDFDRCSGATLAQCGYPYQMGSFPVGQQ